MERGFRRSPVSWGHREPCCTKAGEPNEPKSHVLTSTYDFTEATRQPRAARSPLPCLRADAPTERTQTLPPILSTKHRHSPPDEPTCAEPAPHNQTKPRELEAYWSNSRCCHGLSIGMHPRRCVRSFPSLSPALSPLLLLIRCPALHVHAAIARTLQFHPPPRPAGLVA